MPVYRQIVDQVRGAVAAGALSVQVINYLPSASLRSISK